MSQDLFKGRQVVVLSSINWSDAWQRHQIFAAQFAAAGREVFFIENSGFRNPGLRDLPRLRERLVHLARRDAPNATAVPAGVRIMPPAVLPPTSPAFRRLNAALLLPRLLARLRTEGLRENPIVIAYFATATTLELIRRLEPSLLVYDCASNFRGHPQAPSDFREQERRLLDLADLVVCDSDFLFEQKKAEHADVVQIHQGVPEEFFKAKPPSDPWRRFCYYGTWIADLDPAYLDALCGAGLDVTVSGFLKAKTAFPPTVKILPPTRREDLVRRLELFDSFLLPYRVNSFTVGVIPAKTYECLAMGRPVLAAPLPSLAPLRELMYIAETPADWARIARELPRTETPALRDARIALAREHTHAREFDRLVDALRRAWEKKARGISSR